MKRNLPYLRNQREFHIFLFQGKVTIDRSNAPPYSHHNKSIHAKIQQTTSHKLQTAYIALQFTFCEEKSADPTLLIIIHTQNGTRKKKKCPHLTEDPLYSQAGPENSNYSLFLP